MKRMILIALLGFSSYSFANPGTNMTALPNGHWCGPGVYQGTDGSAADFYHMVHIGTSGPSTIFEGQDYGELHMDEIWRLQFGENGYVTVIGYKNQQEVAIGWGLCRDNRCELNSEHNAIEMAMELVFSGKNMTFHRKAKNLETGVEWTKKSELGPCH